MNIIINFGSAFLGSIIGGLIAIYGGILVVRKTEYYRLRAILKTELRNIIVILSKANDHPATLVENSRIDDLVVDIISVMPFWKRRSFTRDWAEYRYDKNIKIHNMEPVEYTQKSPSDARKIITKRIHNLISKI
ncbi:MAG: hypothetical protein ABSE95_02785 [Thermodesulfobacteriota bacterium]